MSKVASSSFSALLQLKCPRCRRGPMFKHPAYHPKFASMHSNCPVCEQDFEIEPGFYWGAMYISYGLTVGIAIVISVLLYFYFDDPSVPVYLVAIGGVCLLLSPVLFRFSRAMMLHWFSPAKYDKNAG